MKFGQLQTGDVMHLAGTKAVVLSISNPHPEPANGLVGFLLVVWYIFGEDRVSFDCLHQDYDLIPGSTVSKDGLMSWREAVRRVENR